MSIKTTHYVTREFAIAAIKLKKQKSDLDKQRIKDYIRNNYTSGKKLKEFSDGALEYILEEAIHNGFYNFSIVSQETLEDQEGHPFGHHYLNDLDYLPEYNDAH